MVRRSRVHGAVVDLVVGVHGATNIVPPAAPLGGMASDRYGGAGPLQRAKLNPSGTCEVYDAGESDGNSASEFPVGWGSIVRPAPPQRVRVHIFAYDYSLSTLRVCAEQAGRTRTSTP